MKQWEKEFSKRFTDNVLPNGHGNDLIITKEDVEPLMNFIQQTLDQQKAEFMEMIKEIPKRKFKLGERQWCIDCANRIKQDMLKQVGGK